MSFNPETTSVVFRRDLTQVAREYDDANVTRLFKAWAMAPKFNVAETDGRYPLWTRENFKKRPTANTRREGGGYQRIDSEFNQLTFACEEYGLEHKLDDRRASRFATFMDFESEAARVLRYKQLQEWEVRVQTLFETTMSLTNTNVGTAWTTTATADPAADILTAARKIEQKAGVPREELQLFIPTVDFDEAFATQAIQDLVQYTFSRNQGVRPVNLREADLAHMLGFKAVHKLAAYTDTAQEGITESNSAIWTEGIMYIGIFADPDAPLSSMSAARTMRFDRDGGDEIPIMERYRDETIRSDILRAREDTDEVATAEADLFVQKVTNT